MRDTLIKLKIISTSGRINSNHHKLEPAAYAFLMECTPFIQSPIRDTVPERIYCILYGIQSAPVCPSCDHLLTFYHTGRNRNTYQQYCSVGCARKHRNNKAIWHDIQQQMMATHGVTNTSQLKETKNKKKITSQIRYGVDNPSQSETVKEQKRISCQHKYNVNSVFQSVEIQAKTKQTLLRKYGVESPQQCEAVRVKTKNTNNTKYNRNSHTQQHISDKSYYYITNSLWLLKQHHHLCRALTDIADELSVNASTVGNYMKKYNIPIKYFFASTGERDIGNCIKAMGIDIITNDRTTIGIELDIVIPSHNIAIEFCGLYWHSEQLGKHRGYHSNKQQLCKQQGIRLLTIFEDEWALKRDVVLSTLTQLLFDRSVVIYARKCTVVPVSTPTKKQFLNTHHIQGSGASSINIGLSHEGKLVAVMAFVCKSSGSYVLTRFATSVSVVGGFSKLLSHFQRNNRWENLVSFADLRWSEGGVYEKTKWTLDKTIPPDYCYSTGNGQRHHKFNYRRKHLLRLLKTFDPLLSERQNCDNNGLLRIWDCGKLKYVLHNKQLTY